MQRRKWITGIVASIGMIILILDSKTAFQGAKDGVELCIKAVIPSLFPLMLLSGVVANSFMGIDGNWFRFLGVIAGFPRGAESLLIPAYLGGYPVGAQTVAEGWKNGHLSRENAEKMLAFCSNCGPSFLFGMAAGAFSERYAGLLLWGIQIASAITVSRFFAVETEPIPKSAERTASIKVILGNTMKNLASISGWIILLRICIVFMEKWFLWILPNALQVLVIGLLELSNGCISLNRVNNQALRFLICSVLMSFGGICVGLQTESVSRGLSLAYYWKGKLLQAFFSGLLSLLVLKMGVYILPIAPVMVSFLMKTKNRGRNSEAIAV